MSQATCQDVKVTFMHKGKAYGNDRFLIEFRPGQSLEQAVTEKAQNSRYAIDGVEFELDIEIQELAVA